MLPPPEVPGLRWSEAPHVHGGGGSDQYGEFLGGSGLKYAMHGAHQFSPHPTHPAPSHKDAPMQQQWQANGPYPHAQVR